MRIDNWRGTTMRISDGLLPEYDQEMAGTRKMLERVPDDKWGWKPHAKSWTMGQLAAHLMNLPGWIPMTLGSDSLDFARVDGAGLIGRGWWWGREENVGGA